jgi:hypothetical protein
MNKLTNAAVAVAGAFVLSASIAAANPAGGEAGPVNTGVGANKSLFLDLHVDVLSLNCAFDSPVKGRMDYDNANERFDSLLGVSAPATVNLSYRNLTTLSISNDASFNGQANAITSINWGPTTTFAGVGVMPTSSHTASWTVAPSTTPAVGVISLLPSKIVVAEADIPALAIYTEAFVVTCVE